MEASLYRKCLKRTQLQYAEQNKFLSCRPVKSIEDLLDTYPELHFVPNDPDSIDLWRDLVKIATPKNHKKKLQYDQDLNELIEKELHHLVDLQHILVRALQQLGNNCTKVELLRFVTVLSGSVNPFCLGGGSRCDTKRLIIMYEVEANVTAKKRKSHKRSDHGSELSPLTTCGTSSRNTFSVAVNDAKKGHSSILSKLVATTACAASSSSPLTVSTTKRTHSLAFDDGLDENDKIAPGASLKYIFDDMLNFEGCLGKDAQPSDGSVTPAPACPTFLDKVKYLDTQDTFEELIDIQTDSWTLSNH